MLTGETVHFCHSQDWPVTNSRGGPSLSSLENRCLTETLQKLCHCPGSPGVDISTKGNERALDTGGQLCCRKLPLPSDGKLPLPSLTSHPMPSFYPSSHPRVSLPPPSPCPLSLQGDSFSGLRAAAPCPPGTGLRREGVTPPQGRSQKSVSFNLLT